MIVAHPTKNVGCAGIAQGAKAITSSSDEEKRSVAAKRVTLGMCNGLYTNHVYHVTKDVWLCDMLMCEMQVRLWWGKYEHQSYVVALCALCWSLSE